MIQAYAGSLAWRAAGPVVGVVVAFGLVFAATLGSGGGVAALAGNGVTGTGGSSACAAGTPGAGPASHATTPEGVARAAAVAAGTDWDVNVAVAVAGAETGGTYDPTAQNPDSSASGLWQVMLSAHPEKVAAFGDWRDPGANARMAHAIWAEAKIAGRDPWSPWVTYTSGAYRRYLKADTTLAVPCRPAMVVPVAVAGDGKGRTDNLPCPAGQPGPVDVAPGGVPIRVCRVAGLEVNARVAANVAAMLAAAGTAGVELGGSAFRSTARQIELRRAHCSGDIYTAPSSSCSPPTAPPGKSMHEWGLALDLTCGGITIASHTSPCWVWLAANAARYGFRNLPSESWHWSTTGG